MIISLKSEKKIFQEWKKLIQMSLPTNCTSINDKQEWNELAVGEIQVRWRQKLGIIGLRHRFSLPKSFLWMCLGYVVLDINNNNKKSHLGLRQRDILCYLINACPFHMSNI